MQIKQVLNNNVITVLDEQEHELVIMGRGIAFGRKAGDEVDDSKIEKIFKLDDKEMNKRLMELLAEIPLSFVEVSEEIIRYAKQHTSKKIHDNIYVSLTDHIYYAVERFQQGIDIKNALLWETKRFYPDEYRTGQHALSIIAEKVGIILPEDEAGFIALHIVNAQMNEDMPVMINITKFIQDVLHIVKFHFGIEYDEESLAYYRFVTHLKFFAQRILNHRNQKEEDNSLFEMVKNNYSRAFACAQKIQSYIQKMYQEQLTNEDLLYLTIHIHRIVQKKVEYS
ncbi:beta-glucoside operon transcriptional antiterminator [Terribacillus halophilus]|uniref:Beta-glucoside operon transcriptional antiterminator n=1 Tax=Terribacillus halophilus TaxID=361279 RepID=A0A1G6LEQ9_9BACI|nr:PRD domain-containing protein [Terribacillus halophilus]SDC41255.1 beta-glucoside operon transcriptional antiterminator [Terribacillus halophilus]